MIGWYAHHLGLGPMTRAGCVIDLLEDQVVLLSSAPGEGVVHLPMDVDPPRSAACAAAPPAAGLHYAPLGVEGVRRRMAALAAWVDAADPALVVVDGSVEVAALMRLLGVPTAVLRQHGRRDDVAHEQCHQNASALVAPWPEWLEEAWATTWLRERTAYVGGFSRFEGREADPVAARQRLGIAAEERLVVVLTGADGRCGWPVPEADEGTPGWRWVVIGADLWVGDPWDWLCAADVLITDAGHNRLAECATADQPTIVVPEDRPFDEQRHKARLLHQAGIGRVEATWPAASRWAALLEGVVGDPAARLTGLVDGHGAQRAAAAVTDAARRFGSQGAVPVAVA